MALDTAQSRRLGSIRPDSSRFVSIRLDPSRFDPIRRCRKNQRVDPLSACSLFCAS